MKKFLHSNDNLESKRYMLYLAFFKFLFWEFEVYILN